MVEDKDFIGKVWPQNCEDSLLVLCFEKNINKVRYFRCQFQKYPYEVLAKKQSILIGEVINPQINLSYIGKIFPQTCGDSLKILRKIPNTKYFECKFLKYPYICQGTLPYIKKGRITNPQIEKVEFIDKIWPQNCGDSLKIIKKSNKKEGKSYLWECEFINSPCIVYAEKRKIIKKQIENPLFIKEFFEKEYPQHCGDSLKIIKKTEKRSKFQDCLYLCSFIKYPYEILCIKKEILKGNIYNPNLPWNNKESLKNYIINNFNKKPTYKEVSERLQISIPHINHKILEFQLEYLIEYPTESNIEKELRNYCHKLEKDTLNKSTWSKLNGQEIDIFIPKINLGIEYNGNFWHSSVNKENNYHQKKSLLAQDKGIFLMHIFEYEYRNKENIIKSIIKSKLGIFDKILYARNCNIKNLSNKEYQDFCNENHLQGEAGARVKLGLFYKDKLIQIMSFGSPRFTDKFEWEIIRECSKLGYCIVGGKEKLWRYFVITQIPNNCISYCDFSKFNGNSYLKLGFEKVSLNKPGFVWYDNVTNQVFWRNPYKNQEMNKKGYAKIYDAGQLVFTWYK